MSLGLEGLANWGIAKSVKARDFDSRTVGSSPATPATWFASSVGRAPDF